MNASRTQRGVAGQRAALYFRQSLDVQEGIDRQRERCRALAAARGWTVIDEFADNDTSATKERGAATAWSRMLADATAGRFDVVVAVDLDRLLRTIRDLVTLTETGAKVLTVDGEIGYEPDGITVREAEAAAIVEGYAALLAGVPLAAIARQWNSQGHVSAQKRQARSGHAGEPSPFRADSVRTVLQNPRNAGKRAHLGEVVATAEWPALVSEETWLAADSMLKNPARVSGAKSGRYLLSGLAVCGVCGAAAHAGGASRSGVRAYRCGGSTGHFARKAEPVEEYVSAVVVERLSRPDALELIRDQHRPDVGALHDERNGLRGRLDALALDFADGDLTPSQLRTATARLRERLSEVDGKLADAGRIDVLGPLVGADDVRATWEALSVSRKRAIIAALLTVTLHGPGRGVRTFRPESVGIEWINQ